MRPFPSDFPHRYTRVHQLGADHESLKVLQVALGGGVALADSFVSGDTKTSADPTAIATHSDQES